MVNSDGDVLQFMFKYGNYILILPKFNFNQKLVHCSKSRLFATIVFMLLIGNGYIITVIGRFNIVYPLIEAIDRFLDFSTYTLLTTTNIIIILDSLIKRHAWEELLKLLLATNIRITKNQRLLYLTLFILMHVYYLLLLFFDNYIWLNAAEAYLYQYYILRILQEYLCLLMVFFMGMINSMLRSRFRELNHFLMSTHHITHQKNPKKQFLNLYRAVMCYNRIFGWQHLLIVAYAGFSFLDNVDTALIYTDKYSSRVLSYEKFFIVLCVASVAMVSPFPANHQKNDQVVWVYLLIFNKMNFLQVE